MAKKVLYFGSSKGIGLTYHLTAASKYFANLEDVDYTLLSGQREQFPGLFEKLKRDKVHNFVIDGIDEVWNFPLVYKLFLQYVKKEHIEIIHCQTNAHLLYGILAKMFYGCRIIYTIHSYRNGKSWLKSFIMSIFLSLTLNTFADLVITLSSRVKKHFNRFGLKSHFLTLGFEHSGSEKVFSTTTNGIKIIYAGKFHIAKRQKFLIEALEPLFKLHKDIQLYLPGDGDELENCRKLVSELDLSAQVIFPGWQGKEELDALMKQADIAIITSKSENGGHCIVEPLFYSLPVISTPVGIAEDVIRQGENGFIIEHFDDKDLRQNVMFFYNNQGKIAIFGKRSYEIANSELSWSSIADKYRELFIDINTKKVRF